MKRWQAFTHMCAVLRAGLLQGQPAARPDDIDWKLIISGSSFHRVTSTLAWCLRDDDTLPQDVREYLAAVLLLNTQRNERLLDLLARAAAALNGIDIVPVLLKGSADLVEDLYPVLGARILTDIDLLIPWERALKARKEFERLGFSIVSEATEYHLPMLSDGKSGIGIELHTLVLPRRFMGVIDLADFQDNAVDHVFRGARVRFPQATGRMAHNIGHTAIYNGLYDANTIELRQLLDQALIQARHAGAIDWGRLTACFVAAGHARVLSTNLHYTAELLGAPAPAIAELPPPKDLYDLHESMEPDFLRRAARRLARLGTNPLGAFRLIDPRRLPYRIRRIRRNLRPWQ